MKKRILTTVMALTLGAAMLTACGSKADEATTPVETEVADTTTVPATEDADFEETTVPATEENADSTEEATEDADSTETATEDADSAEETTEAVDSTEEAASEETTTEEAAN